MTDPTTVTIAAVTPDGEPAAYRRVIVQLIHGGAGGTVDGNLIADRSTVRLDAAGEGSIDLYPNAAISPANTYYSFTVDNSSPTIVRLVSVPASGPVSWTDAGVLLEDPSPPTVVPGPDGGTVGQVVSVVDDGNGKRYDLIDHTGGVPDTTGANAGDLLMVEIPGESPVWSGAFGAVLEDMGTVMALVGDTIDADPGDVLTVGTPGTLPAYAPPGVYTPADAAVWDGSPTTLAEAIDRLAAVVGDTTPIP